MKTIRKILACSAFLVGLGVITVTLLLLHGDVLQGQQSAYAMQLAFGGTAYVAICRGNLLFQDFWRSSAKLDHMRPKLRFYLLPVASILSVLAIKHYISNYGYNVLPEGITVPLGNAEYAKLCFVVYYLIIVLNVLCMTSPSGNNSSLSKR